MFPRRLGKPRFIHHLNPNRRHINHNSHNRCFTYLVLRSDSGKERRFARQATTTEGDYGGTLDEEEFSDDENLDSEEDVLGEEEDLDFEDDADADLDVDDFSLPEDDSDTGFDRIPALGMLDDDDDINDPDALAALVDQTDREEIMDQDEADYEGEDDMDDDAEIIGEDLSYIGEEEEEDEEVEEDDEEVEEDEDEDEEDYIGEDDDEDKGDDNEAVRSQILDDDEDDADEETKKRALELLERYVGEEGQREFEQQRQEDAKQYEALKQAARQRIDALGAVASAQAGPKPPGAEEDRGTEQKQEAAEKDVLDIDALIEDNPQNSALFHNGTCLVCKMVNCLLSEQSSMTGMADM
jgi:hypothetical protein